MRRLIFGYILVSAVDVSNSFKQQSKMWHLLVVKWCLYLQHLSGKAYEIICNSEIIKLSFSRTLQDYKHLEITKIEIGFSVEADRQLLDILKQKDDLVMCGMVLFDEMYLKQGLVLRSPLVHCFASLIKEKLTTNWMNLKHLWSRMHHCCKGHWLKPWLF